MVKDKRPTFEHFDSTINFYDTNSQRFYEQTIHLDVTHLYEPFIEHLTAGNHILDAGCGPGRDSLYFLNKGFRVTAIDASLEMTKIAMELIDQPVFHLSFQELEFENEFDAVWACASLLHVPKGDIYSAIANLSKSLKPGGIFFASFKYGDEEEIKSGRIYNYYSEDSFREVIEYHPELSILKMWITNDTRPGKHDDLWLNVIMLKDLGTA
jgi:SAM-dependent methyltransferase